jgi:SAM-dependent methyltransferase
VQFSGSFAFCGLQGATGGDGGRNAMGTELSDSISKARVLIVIASYGTANDRYLARVISEYKLMPFRIKIIVLTNSYKKVDPEIELKIGLPSKDPWSLPFGHQRIFAEHINEYDLFVYSEDDILIRERNIRAIVDITACLEPSEIAGFLRVEYDNNSRKYFCDIHNHFHWHTDSVVSRKEYTLAFFSNEHAACYMLTKEQLKTAINSGGFLVAPHCWKYDLLCTAATDVYTQCGWTKLIAISHLAEICVEHLSNKYVGKWGIGDDDLKRQIEYLMGIGEKKQRGNQLLPSSTNLLEDKYSKKYYEPANTEIVSLIKSGPCKILSIGCGLGRTEQCLSQLGHEVIALPLDLAISSKARDQGIEVLKGGLLEVYERLRSDAFDYVIIDDILNLMLDPTEFLRSISEAMKMETTLIVQWTNMSSIRNLYFDAKRSKYIGYFSSFEMARVHFLSMRIFRRWCKIANISIVQSFPVSQQSFSINSKRSYNFLDLMLASGFISVARKSGTQVAH